jgi:hypothetical protein
MKKLIMRATIAGSESRITAVAHKGGVVFYDYDKMVAGYVENAELSHETIKAACETGDFLLPAGQESIDIARDLQTAAPEIWGPYRIYANVLLLDGKIINWKTSRTTCWDSLLTAFLSRQPMAAIMADPERLSVDSKALEFESTAENKEDFIDDLGGFYREFEIHPDFPENMFRPYPRETFDFFVAQDVSESVSMSM